MKVGIITMHKVVHHGSVLQSFATQRIIEHLGYDAELIDYDYPNPIQVSHGMWKKKFSILSKISYILGLKKHHIRHKRISKFMNKNYKTSKFYKDLEAISLNPPIYDVYLTGSDQVWNSRFTYGDTGYLLSFAPDNSRKISYSSSFAQKKIPHEYREIYKSYLSKYQFISVREKQGQAIIKELLGRECKVTLDPTLLINQTEWSTYTKSKFKFKNTKYIYLYVLKYAYNPIPYIYEVAKYFQDKFGYQIISNSSIDPKFNLRYIDYSEAGIEDFLTLIQNSALVLTSSFHGTAFAVNFGVPLLAITPIETDDDRLSSLLKSLDLENCIVPYGTELSDLSPNYDVKREQLSLNRLRSESLEFLKIALNK